MVAVGTTQAGLCQAYSRSCLLSLSYDKREQSLCTSFLSSSNQNVFRSTVPPLLASKGRLLRRQKVLDSGGLLRLEERGSRLIQKSRKLSVRCLQQTEDAQTAAQVSSFCSEKERRGLAYIEKSRRAIFLFCLEQGVVQTRFSVLLVCSLSANKLPDDRFMANCSF
jgi:hypothetical protein